MSQVRHIKREQRDHEHDKAQFAAHMTMIRYLVKHADKDLARDFHSQLNEQGLILARKWGFQSGK